MSYQVTLLDEHAAALRALVLPANGHEGAAYVLLRRACTLDPWDRARRTRHVSREGYPDSTRRCPVFFPTTYFHPDIYLGPCVAASARHRLQARLRAWSSEWV